MIYPYTPFIAEEMYLSLPEHKESIMLESYPEVSKNVRKNKLVSSQVKLLETIIKDVRNYKSNNKLAPNASVKLSLISKEKLFDGFDELTPRQFLTMYRQNPLVSRIYELYIPTNDGSFRLSTTEDDAKELIDTFIEEKNEMIMKAKAEDEMSSKDLEEFVQELTSVKLRKNREQGKAKLKRKDLTPEQIKQLEELGWDDLIE